ncbi:hypothetical protein ATANTOWER_019538 [Ataeniobius toweri]|uniref:Uncharacterized protein n=1 Tax=Ataeniobius toweri TaxID=208326 RepID=A0ABU7AG36_9TELE|nr:hypothetical protein [Ataeniobius toweri]
MNPGLYQDQPSECPCFLRLLQHWLGFSMLHHTHMHRSVHTVFGRQILRSCRLSLPFRLRLSGSPTHLKSPRTGPLSLGAVNAEWVWRCGPAKDGQITTEQGVGLGGGVIKK